LPTRASFPFRKKEKVGKVIWETLRSRKEEEVMEYSKREKILINKGAKNNLGPNESEKGEKG